MPNIIHSQVGPTSSSLPTLKDHLHCRNQKRLLGTLPLLCCNFLNPLLLFMHFSNNVYRWERSSSVQLSSSRKFNPCDREKCCLFFLAPLRRILSPTLGWLNRFVAWSVVAILTPRKNVPTWPWRMLKPVDACCEVAFESFSFFACSLVAVWWKMCCNSDIEQILGTTSKSLESINIPSKVIQLKSKVVPGRFDALTTLL